MAVLQAARAFVLGLPLDAACSWGLNRAIFIAAAKRGFRGGGEKGGEEPPKDDERYFLGDDMAYRVPGKGKLLFTIGGEVQDLDAFDKQVKSRFGSTFQAVWKESLAYVGKFDKKVLLSREGFFSEVYRPARDDLARKWTEQGLKP